MTTLLAAVGVLSLLMLIHELGHFIVAKRIGLHVEEFGLGSLLACSPWRAWVAQSIPSI